MAYTSPPRPSAVAGGDGGDGDLDLNSGASKPIKFYFVLTAFLRLLIAVLALVGIVVQVTTSSWPPSSLVFGMLFQSICLAWSLLLLARAVCRLTRKGKLAFLPRIVFQIGPWRCVCGGPGDDDDDADNAAVPERQPLLDLSSTQQPKRSTYVVYTDLIIAATLLVYFIIDFATWKRWNGGRVALWTLLIITM